MILNLPYKLDSRGIKTECASLEESHKKHCFRKLPPGVYEQAQTYLMYATENYF